MGILSNIFGAKADGLDEKAGRLVAAARMQGPGMFPALVERYPVLTEGLPRWNLVITVAVAFLAASRLNDVSISKERRELLLATIARDLHALHPSTLEVFDDCRGFYDRQYDTLAANGHDRRFLTCDSLGFWIVWNALGRQPKTQEEGELVRASGLLVTTQFFDWWIARPQSAP